MESTDDLSAADDVASQRNSPRSGGTPMETSNGLRTPFNPRRSELHGQHFRQSLASWRAGLARSFASADGCVLTSADGTLAFALLRIDTGLLIERRHCPAAGPRTAQTMLFNTSAAFDRWCSSEPVRFREPVLFSRLHRKGHEAFCADR